MMPGTPLASTRQGLDSCETSCSYVPEKEAQLAKEDTCLWKRNADPAAKFYSKQDERLDTSFIVIKF